MRKLLLRSLALGCLAASAATVSAQDAPVVFDFRLQANFDKCTHSSPTIDRVSKVWQFYSYQQNVYLYNGYSAFDFDDYLTTPEIDLETNHLYKWHLAPAPYAQSDPNPFHLDLLIGRGEDPTAFNVINEFRNLTYATSYSAEDRVVEFFVTETGKHRLSLHGKSTVACYRMYVEDHGANPAPLAVSDFTVTPDINGAAKAVITFTMPMTTKSGGELSGTQTYKIYRGQTLDNGNPDPNPILVHSGTAAKGTAISWTDDPAPEGEADYHVEIIDGDETSDRVTTHAFIGPEIPAATSKATLTLSGNTATLTWEAVTAGIHGAALNTANVSYQLTRVVDGVETPISQTVTATSYTEDFTPEELQALSYKVQTVYGSKLSDAVESNSVKLGTIPLPFADSFAENGEPVLKKWWDVELVDDPSDNKKIWVVYDRSPQAPSNYPQDGDGGLIFYESYNARKGASSRLYTAPIAKEAATNPTLQYWFYHHTSGNDQMQLQVSLDGGEWANVGEPLTLASDEYPSQWKKYTVALADAIAQCQTSYRIGFLALSSWGSNMSIDNVKIFNMKSHDLAASSIKCPESMTPGKEITLTVNIDNNGSTDVQASDYSVSVITDFPGEIPAITTVDIPSLGSASMQITLPVNSAQAAAAESYTFSAKVDYAADEEPANNTSAPSTVNTQFLDETRYPAVENLQMTENADGSVNLTWDFLTDPDYVPINISESFEDCEDEATDNINGFTILDLDESAGQNYYMLSGSKLKVATKTADHPTSGVDGNKLLGVTFRKTGTQNQSDWIISPRLDGNAGNNLSISFLVGFKSMSSYMYYYSYEILYTTDDSFDPADPTAAFTFLSKYESNIYTNYGEYSGEKMVEISCNDIPSSAKYIAIHLNAKVAADMAIFIDNIRIKEVQALTLEGYNVYENSVKINEELIPTNTNTFSVPAPAAQEASATAVHPVRNYFVSAVYDAGESKPSNTVKTAEKSDLAITGITAPEMVKNGEAFDVTVDVANLGNTTAENYEVALYKGTTEIAKASEVPAIEMGQTAQIKFSRTLTDADPMATTYHAVVTFEGDINADNNTSADVTVNREVIDLALSELTAPANVNVGEPFEVTVKVTNKGNVTMEGNNKDYSVGLWELDKSVLTNYECPTVAPGESAVITFNGKFFTVSDPATMQLHAEIFLNNDAVDANTADNTTPAIIVNRNPFTLDAPSDLEATHNDEGIMLVWRAPLITLPGDAGLKLQGYNIYRNDVKVATQETPWPYNVFTDTEALADGKYTYKVTTVYNVGESEACTPIEVIVSGINGVFAGNVKVQAAESRIAIIGADGRQAAIYNASGILVYEGPAEKAVERTFLPGVYVVTVPPASFKVHLR